MITIYKNRLVPKDRISSVGVKAPTEQVVSYDNFARGLDTSRSRFGRPDGSLLVADNVTIESGGAAPRAGCRALAKAPKNTSFKRLLNYTRTGQIFAVNDYGIFEISKKAVSDSEPVPVPARVYSKITEGAVCSIEMQNDAGTFLTVLNGKDRAAVFDGGAWHQMSQGEIIDTHKPYADVVIGDDSVSQDEAIFTISGVNTADLSFGWVHQSRQYFVEKGSLSAWYLGPNSISGLAKEATLQGVFSESSELLFGTSFSIDSGAGLDDFNVFVTKEGEIAVYTGNNPDDVSSFVLKGVYKIPTPLGRNAHMNVGGDVIIATVDGLIPLSAVFQKDIANLSLHSMSRAIDDDIRIEADLAPKNAYWSLVRSDHHNLAFFVLPRRFQPEKHLYVVNMTTGGWSRFVGWLVVDMTASGNGVFYTDGDMVYEALVTGRDNGKAIQHSICTAFDDFGADGREKIVHKARVSARSDFPINLQISVMTNLEIDDVSFPKATGSIGPDDTAWAEFDGDPRGGKWNESRWAETYKPLKSQWVESSHYSLYNSAAILTQFATDGESPLRAFVLGASISYTTGENFS